MFVDLFVAGTDTTSRALEWAMTEVLRNPETLRKVKAELDEVIGKHNILEEADVSRLPFLRCVLKETMRLQKQGSPAETRPCIFSSRTVPDALQGHDHFKYSVAWLPVASRWRSLRKILNSSIFSVSCLDANQHLRRQKVEELVVYCRKSAEIREAVDLGQAAFRTSLSLLSNMIFSRDLADPYLDSAKEFKDLVREVMEEAGKPNLVDFFPVLEKLDPQRIRRRMSGYFQTMIDIFKALIDERLEKGISQDRRSDMLDVLLNISKESPDKIDRAHIENLFVDLFAAGTDTTSSSLEWAMTEVLRNPETLRKAKAELDEVIGKRKILEEGDVASLPYLQCVVKETMRLHPPVPLLIPRKVDQDVDLCGFTVPKDSQVFVNIWAIGRDADTWTDPLEFKPERFLDSEVDFRGTDFELIPFGAGRRICPGLPLAVRVVPVMLGSLLNSFDWELEGDVNPDEVNMEEKFGITLQKAHPFRAIPFPL